ncbi:MAG: response regulator [Alphaproteobacteria bacterium]|nr:response regulator [Alphaproteobacteria bacterium]
MSNHECCVLVIDDESGVREVIFESLRLCGYKMLQAENGKNAMDLIEQGCRPNIVVTDLIMPEQDGMETIQLLRQNFPQIKLVAISGGGRRNNVDFLTLADDLGVDATLPKPLDMDELERIVQKLAARAA